ncbi:hypothetical protein Pelo_17118 [Pelomyxa schiedti]|nr:hypothetical protein Pelo_17118 [Pelomyxa schiedti]
MQSQSGVLHIVSVARIVWDNVVAGGWLCHPTPSAYCPEERAIEVAKWVIDRFRVREPWEFIMPFEAAIIAGQLEVAWWLSTLPSADLVHKLQSVSHWVCPLLDAAYSGSPCAAKWCTEMFPFQRGGTHSKSFIFEKAMRCDSVEHCQCFREGLELEFPLETSWCNYIENLDIFKWVNSTFPVLRPTAKNLEESCREIGDLALVKWLVEEQHVA